MRVSKVPCIRVPCQGSLCGARRVLEQICLVVWGLEKVPVGCRQVHVLDVLG